MVLNLISQDLKSVLNSKQSHSDKKTQSQKSSQALAAGVYVTFSLQRSKKAKALELVNSELQEILQSSIQDKLVTGKANETAVYKELNFNSFRHVIVVGLGVDDKITHETYRQAMAAAYEAIKSLHATEAFVDFNDLSLKKNSAQTIKAAVEGLELVSYEFENLKSGKKDKTKKKDLNIHLLIQEGKNKDVQQAFHDAIVLAQTINFSKYLGDMPGNLMTPEILAQKTLEAIKGTKLKATIWNKQRIQKEKMGGLLGVSLGSAVEPRFIVLEYHGAAKTEKPVAFVGKGLTFDSGGISIKPSAAMEEMKYDMCGGANVIGTLIAIAKLKLKINAIGLVPATENMPGPLATKPGDILTARNGKTFEVNNTDAEGRLILSDALVYASEQKPQVIIDAATLTGAMVVALGNTHTGYFTRNKELKNRIEKAAEESGEWVWNMPLTDYHVQDMKGTYADLSNISSGKGAGSATAAAFLEQFVEEDIPWAHFDIAGTGWAVGSRLRYCTKKGASGAMIRTFVEIAKSYEK